MDGGAGTPEGRRIALLIENDGTAYRGSQYQENGPSIQAVLEVAINNLTGEQVRAAFAGRTDAGVHALGQVAAFTANTAIETVTLRRGLNHFLPPDVVIRAAMDVPESFDPRRDAIGRIYRYGIDNRPARPALDRDRAWHVPRRLDVRAMRETAAPLLGEHDFAAFAAPYEGRTVRTLDRCDVQGNPGGEITVEMRSRAFLPHQVRRTVGPLVEVGQGRMAASQLETWIREAKASTAAPAAPPHGLYLVRVEYAAIDFDVGEQQ
jgi:tRNA pseudouridine38-40 synthase